MTVAEAAEIFRYWEENPPPHLLLQAIARLLGWTPPPVAGGAPPAEEIAAAAPPGLAVARGAALGVPLPLDAEGLRDHNRAMAVQIARRNAGKAVG